MTNNIIKQANNFLSRFSLNRYVMTPLNEFDLNEVSIIDYLEQESLSISQNDLSYPIALGQIEYEEILKIVQSFSDISSSNQDSNTYLVDIFLQIKTNNLEQKFVKETRNQTGYPFDTFDEILNCLVLKNFYMPLGDQLPLATNVHNRQVNFLP
ncbi:hypothetical protein ACYSNO_04850 [Enterococcus sp. LJL98]